MPVFVLVNYEYPSDHCNSGTLSGLEIHAETLKREWYLPPNDKGDAELIAFLANAKVGEYMSVLGGGAFLFRTR